MKDLHKMKIVFFGDSYTEGTPFPTKDPYIWPNLLGRKFRAKVDNQYHPGGSNHAILRKFCRYFQNNTADVAIIMWSHWLRNEIQMGEKVYQIQPSNDSFPADFTRKFYGNRNEQLDWEDFLDKIWIVDKICPIPHIQGCCFPLYKDFDKPKNWFPYSMFDMALNMTPCGHPQKNGHKNIYELMARHLQKNKIVL